MKDIRIKDTHFIDRDGKEILLSGINMVCKEKEKGYLGDYKEEDFAYLSSLGFRIVRFGIFWDGVEPECGTYDDNYLEQIRSLAHLAKKHGISFYLDMHQDLFSAEFCDGAPGWATLTNGETYEKTELWSEAYLTSPAVQLAFDNFWNDTPAADGIGIQTHYLNMGKHIAEFFQNESNIIGYDCLNEPFPGSACASLLEGLFTSLAMHLSSESHIATEEEIMGIWMDNEKKAALLSDFSEYEQYSALVTPLGEALKTFDETVLSSFYQKLRDSIRSVDKEVLLFIETNYFCNTGIPSGVLPPKDENGQQDKGLVYAPHGYDLMVDTDQYESDTFVRLDVIFDAHKEYAEKFHLPVLIGEWGCYPNANEAQKKEASYLLSKFKSLCFSNTYYDYSTFHGNPIVDVLKKQ